MKRNSSLIIGLGLLALAASASADPVYRWVDAQGVVSYGSKPPPNAAGLRTVAIDQSQPSGGGYSSADTQRRTEDLADAERERAAQQKADAKAEAKAKANRDKAIREAQREQHQQECADGTLGPADCGDVSIGYYPVVGYRGQHPQIAQTPPAAAPAPVVHQNSSVVKTTAVHSTQN